VTTKINQSFETPSNPRLENWMKPNPIQIQLGLYFNPKVNCAGAEKEVKSSNET
jgi:hypothetical protein